MRTAINYNNAIDWFRFLSGEDDVELAIRHCMPAVESIQAKVLSNQFRVDAIPQLYYAAATLAFYHYILSKNDAQPTSIDAGDLTVRLESQKVMENARELLENALAAAKPFMKNGAVFKSIGGIG